MSEQIETGTTKALKALMNPPVEESSLINAAACKRKLIQEARNVAYHWKLAGEGIRVSKETLAMLERTVHTTIIKHVTNLQRKGKTI